MDMRAAAIASDLEFLLRTHLRIAQAELKNASDTAKRIAAFLCDYCMGEGFLVVERVHVESDLSFARIVVQLYDDPYQEMTVTADI